MSFVHFLMQHIFLVCTAVLALIWSLYEESRAQDAKSHQKTPQETIELMNHNNAVVLDVRDTQVIRDQGTISNSICIPVARLHKSAARFKAHRTRPLIVLGLEASDFKPIRVQLERFGCTKIYILRGGLAAWRAAGMPIARPK